MQYIYIDTMWDDDYQKYLDKLSSLDVEQELKIIIHTTGGDNELCDILSKELSKFKYHIDCYSAQSAWMILLDRLHNNALSISICDYSIYMVHLPARTLPIGMWGKISRGIFEKHCNTLMESAKPHTFDILTPEEQKRYLNGDDIYIMPQIIKEYYEKLA